MDKLTIFTFMWACQAMVHHEFYHRWLKLSDPFGWLVLGFSVAVLLVPRSLALLMCLLLSSCIYNFLAWPFVANHILAETIINVTCLSAITVSWLRRGKQEGFRDVSLRDKIFDRFAPVAVGMLVLIYYFAFVAKLNWGFVNTETSCVVIMYADLLDRFPFLPGPETAGGLAIAATFIVEFLLPILLTFRKTRPLGVMLGVPFHLILGLVGHRTFSALAFALYAVMCMDQLVVICNQVGAAWRQRTTPKLRKLVRFSASALVVAGVATLVAASFLGHYRDGLGPLKFFRIPWLIWIGWTLSMGAVYAVCTFRFYRPPLSSQSSSLREPTARPGIVWALLALVVLNGTSQYLGFKTETCFTMYSNLRTEGDYNNHMLIPKIRLTQFQDDLVEVVSTSIPELEPYVNSDLRMTYFELRRVVSTTEGDFDLAYVRSGERHTLSRVDDQPSSASELLSPHPYWQTKLLLFRPVSTAECAPCQH